MKAFIFLTVLLYSQLSFAEPQYCALDTFIKLEIPSPLSASETQGLIRLHSFRLGETVLAGLAVGDSDARLTKKLALASAQPGVDQNKYCTWYFAKSNKLALASFISHMIQDPFSIKPENAAQVFMDAIGSSFFKDEAQSFLSCAQDQHYIAMGCTEQRHRGPTVFAMLLAFSGCSPEHSYAIVDKVWGLNGLKPEVRMNAIKAAYEYGNQNPNERARFSELLTKKAN